MCLSHSTQTFVPWCMPLCVQSELPFLNSMKMKMSILLGVVHMNLGIVMSLFNNVYFKDRLSTICEFIPQVGVWTGVWGNSVWGNRCMPVSFHHLRLWREQLFSRLRHSPRTFCACLNPSPC
jgi:hypothetical protein